MFRYAALFRSPEGDPPAAPMIKVTIDGTEREIPRPAGLIAETEVAEKYVPKAAHNSEMARMRTQLDGTKHLKNPDDLLEDQEFRTKAITKWGIDPNAGAEQFQKQIVTERETIINREVKPLQARLEKATTQIGSLLNRDLERQILQAAQGKVDAKYLKPASKGGEPIIVAMVRNAFAYDEQHADWFAKGQGGSQPFQFSSSGETPYMGAAEFIQTWLAGDGKDFAVNEKQEGPSANTTGAMVPGQVGKEIRVTSAQIRDTAGFRLIQQRATKEGLTIVRID